MRKFDQINVIPFIDIMLVLLAIVLMTATFLSQGKISVKLPESSTASKMTAQTNEAQRITITSSGEYYLNDELRTLTQIDTISSAWKEGQSVILKIDAESRFDEFVQIGDILRRNNLVNISLQTVKANN